MPEYDDWDRLTRMLPGYDPHQNKGDSEFDRDAAQDAVDFFPLMLRHVEGEMAGKPFVLEDWEKAFVGNLFGWKWTDSKGRRVRRFRECLLYVARKNGKTPLTAGIATYVLFCDKEKGQQNYIAAGEREQAGMLFRQMKGMIEQEPELMSRCKMYGGNASAGQSKSIVREDEGSFLRVISADADTKHGGTTHLAIIDELHVQPTRDLYDVLRTSMASDNRPQPLLICITTADYYRESICNEVHRYASMVRDGQIDDPQFLPAIYELAKGDNWTDPNVWHKANPNLGVSVSSDFMHRECKIAQEKPSYQNNFKRLHLNIITEQAEKWIDMDAWDKCATDSIRESDLIGVPCWIGVDLGATRDASAAVVVWRIEEERYYLRSFFWIPEDAVDKRAKQDRRELIAWANSGHITKTPGNATFYATIAKDVFDLIETYNVQKIGFDPAGNAYAWVQQLHSMGASEDITQTYSQGWQNMAGPTKEFDRLIVTGRLQHNGNPLMRWMCANAVKKQDSSGNIRPDKGRSSEKIDGVVAAIMAVGMASAGTGDTDHSYDKSSSVSPVDSEHDYSYGAA